MLRFGHLNAELVPALLQLAHLSLYRLGPRLVRSDRFFREVQEGLDLRLCDLRKTQKVERKCERSSNRQFRGNARTWIVFSKDW